MESQWALRNSSHCETVAWPVDRRPRPLETQQLSSDHNKNNHPRPIYPHSSRNPKGRGLLGRCGWMGSRRIWACALSARFFKMCFGFWFLVSDFWFPIIVKVPLFQCEIEFCMIQMWSSGDMKEDGYDYHLYSWHRVQPFSIFDSAVIASVIQ